MLIHSLTLTHSHSLSHSHTTYAHTHATDTRSPQCSPGILKATVALQQPKAGLASTPANQAALRTEYSHYFKFSDALVARMRDLLVACPENPFIRQMVVHWPPLYIA